eukprot:23092-Pelagococcus_subviridis.AAC.5
MTSSSVVVCLYLHLSPMKHFPFWKFLHSARLSTAAGAGPTCLYLHLSPIRQVPAAKLRHGSRRSSASLRSAVAVCCFRSIASQSGKSKSPTPGRSIFCAGGFGLFFAGGGDGAGGFSSSSISSSLPYAPRSPASPPPPPPSSSSSPPPPPSSPSLVATLRFFPASPALVPAAPGSTRDTFSPLRFTTIPGGADVDGFAIPPAARARAIPSATRFSSSISFALWNIRDVALRTPATLARSRGTYAGIGASSAGTPGLTYAPPRRCCT